MKKNLFTLLLAATLFMACKKDGRSNTNSANQPIVSTLAGNGLQSNTNGLGTAASFSNPIGVTVDATGNIYVADYANQLIRKITPAGLVSTLAGSGALGNTNGLGIAASFNFPQGVAVDAAGNVYVADTMNNLIRKISPTGLVSTFASIGSPQGVAVDAADNVYVVDGAGNQVFKITSAGLMSTFAGSGIQGNINGIGTAASFYYPTGVTVDASGNVYVADDNNGLIRKITPAGVVSTLAGDGGYGICCTIINGLGTSATFNDPYALTVDGVGNVYVTDSSINLIRKITPAGLVSTFAGTGAYGSTNGIVSIATFYFPEGIAFDASSGSLYVVDTNYSLIRKITMN